MVDLKCSDGARKMVLAAGMAVALVGLAGGAGTPAIAAERVVMAESFTATW